MKPTLRKSLFTVFLGWFLFFIPKTSLAEKSAIEILSENNYKVLSGRVYAMLTYRLQNLKSCDLSTHSKLYNQYMSLAKYTNSKVEAAKYLQLYYETYQVSNSCKESLDKAELAFHQMERKKFSSFYFVIDKLCSSSSSDYIYEGQNCKVELTKILQDLNPHCISTQIDYDKKYHDNFECMVGDYLIGRTLYHSYPTPEEFISKSKEFFLNFWNQSYKKQNSESLELYSVFLGNQKDTSHLRKTFLATITMLLSSTQSMSPYTKGFHDYFWRRKLFDSKSPEQAVELFNSAKLLVDEFRTINRIIQEKNKNILMVNQPMSALNRHNYMAAFLACHYQNQSKAIQKGLPLMLGYAYESLDFIDHIKNDGDSVKVAYKNFEVDTNRYKVGVKLGYTFCDSKSLSQ